MAGMIGLLICSVAALLAPQDRLTHGPILGHVEPTRATVWARSHGPGKVVLRVADSDGRPFRALTAKAESKNDLCLIWRIEGLKPGRSYTYTLAKRSFIFQTPAQEEVKRRVKLIFGSCARDKEAETWAAIRGHHPEAVVLLGDTPYIDSTRLEVQLRRYREFFAGPGFAETFREASLYATWDDHDFGRNDTDGRLKGKENSRKAFLAYHANPSYGEDGQGIYTSFRRGPVEVFLLDTRWFAGTKPSPADSGKRTLLGRAQWEWLRKGLQASTATFKVLASGMIWNGATRPNKPDHWESYPHERNALFRFIGEKKIPGVVLVGGDIHRSRALRYPAKETGAGYDLTELITSPLHSKIIKAANAPSPYLLHDAGVPHSFLLLTADSTVAPPRLTGRCLTADGKEHFSIRLDAGMLKSGK